jgi:hypothetical protein
MTVPECTATDNKSNRTSGRGGRLTWCFCRRASARRFQNETSLSNGNGAPSDVGDCTGLPEHQRFVRSEYCCRTAAAESLLVVGVLTNRPRRAASPSILGPSTLELAYEGSSGNVNPAHHKDAGREGRHPAG